MGVGGANASMGPQVPETHGTSLLHCLLLLFISTLGKVNKRIFVLPMVGEAAKLFYKYRQSRRVEKV